MLFWALMASGQITMRRVDGGLGGGQNSPAVAGAGLFVGLGRNKPGVGRKRRVGQPPPQAIKAFAAEPGEQAVRRKPPGASRRPVLVPFGL